MRGGKERGSKGFKKNRKSGDVYSKRIVITRWERGVRGEGSVLKGRGSVVKGYFSEVHK